MGVPDVVSDQAGSANRDNNDLPPFGVMERSRRTARLPQGGIHSGALLNGFIDIMAEMQHGMADERGVMVEGEWDKEWELLTRLFADDAHHCASGSRCVEGPEEMLEIATLSGLHSFGWSTGQPSAMLWWADGVKASGLRTGDGQVVELRRWSG